MLLRIRRGPRLRKQHGSDVRALANASAPRTYDGWEIWQKGVIQFLVLALKIISALAIIALFAIAECAGVGNVARALADEPAHVPSKSETGCTNQCCSHRTK